MGHFSRYLILVPMMLVPASQVSAFDILRPDLWFAADECRADIPDIRVRTQDPQVVIDNTMDHEFMDMQSRTLANAAMNGWRTNGLASANLRTEGTLSIRTFPLRDGSWCATLEAGDFFIGYKSPIEVYVTRRFSPSSCQYRAVLEHEMEHVKIYESVLKAHLESAELIIGEPFLMGAISGVSVEVVTEQLETAVGGIVNSLVDGIIGETKVRNESLDTPQSYLKVQSRCAGW